MEAKTLLPNQVKSKMFSSRPESNEISANVDVKLGALKDLNRKINIEPKGKKPKIATRSIIQAENISKSVFRRPEEKKETKTRLKPLQPSMKPLIDSKSKLSPKTVVKPLPSPNAGIKVEHVRQKAVTATERDAASRSGTLKSEKAPATFPAVPLPGKHTKYPNKSSALSKVSALPNRNPESTTPPLSNNSGKTLLLPTLPKTPVKVPMVVKPKKDPSHLKKDTHLGGAAKGQKVFASGNGPGLPKPIQDVNIPSPRGNIEPSGKEKIQQTRSPVKLPELQLDKVKKHTSPPEIPKPENSIQQTLSADLDEDLAEILRLMGLYKRRKGLENRRRIPTQQTADYKSSSSSTSDKGSISTSGSFRDLVRVHMRNEKKKEPMKITQPPKDLKQNVMDVDAPLLASGPFAVGDAKACLDDLQATLLRFWNKVYQIEPDIPLDWQIEQLRRSFYPSPYPISPPGLFDDFIQQSANLNSCSLPPKKSVTPRYSVNSTSGKNLADPVGGESYVGVKVRSGNKPLNNICSNKVSEHGVLDGTMVESLAKDAKAAANIQRSKNGDESAAVRTLGAKCGDSGPDKEKLNVGNQDHRLKVEEYSQHRPREWTHDVEEGSVLTVIKDLMGLAESNSTRISKLNKEIGNELGGGAGCHYWRENVPRGIRRPLYFSKSQPEGQMFELESHVEMLYRNLLIEAEWNRKEINLLEDRMKLSQNISGESRDGL